MNSKSNAQAMETEKIPRLLAQLAIPAVVAQIINLDRKSTRLNSSHIEESRMPSSA